MDKVYMVTSSYGYEGLYQQVGIFNNLSDAEIAAKKFDEEHTWNNEEFKKLVGVDIDDFHLIDTIHYDKLYDCFHSQYNPENYIDYNGFPKENWARANFMYHEVYAEEPWRPCIIEPIEVLGDPNSPWNIVDGSPLELKDDVYLIAYKTSFECINNICGENQLPVCTAYYKCGDWFLQPDDFIQNKVFEETVVAYMELPKYFKK